jgi:eukaryotic-like serine/threonine-protein kinase
MSPEHVRGRVADARSGIFAAGVILYEMLTGKTRFPESDFGGDDDGDPERRPAGGVADCAERSAGLQRIVNRCLAKSPEQCFQHASDLGFALESLSDSSGSTVGVRIPGGSQNIPKSLKPNAAKIHNCSE